MHPLQIRYLQPKILRSCKGEGFLEGRVFPTATPVHLLFYQSGWSLAQIPWKCLQTGRRCGEFLVLANPLIFNGICFDIAFPIRNNFISLFLKVSLFFCRLIYLMGSFSGYPPLEELVVLKGPYFVFVSAVVQALSPRILLAS